MSWQRSLTLTAFALLFAVSGPADAQTRVPDGPIAEVRFEGLKTIPVATIKARLLSKAGQPFDAEKIDADIKSLMQSNEFRQVEAYFDESSPKSGRYVVIFVVREQPVLTHVEFRGRKAVPLEEIEKATGLKAGRRFDRKLSRWPIGSITRLYHERGYHHVEVKLIEGDDVDSTRIVFEIKEGQRETLGVIHLVGCHFASPATLLSAIGMDRAISADDSREYDEEFGERWAAMLGRYYRSEGFFEARITPTECPGKKPGEIDITFTISEGPRYSIGKVSAMGNQRIATESLLADLHLRPGAHYRASDGEADTDRIRDRYIAIGCIDAEVSVQKRFTLSSGVVDLVYTIREGDPFLLGEMDLGVNGNEQTRERVMKREAAQTARQPSRSIDQDRQ